MVSTHTVSSAPLTLTDLRSLLSESATINLSKESVDKIKRCREYLDQKIAKDSNPVYGINTGFGSLYNKHIPGADLERLQDNLVKSHACGMGPVIPDEIVRLMLFLKVQSLSYGYSGVQLETVQRLVDFFNNKIYPKVYEMGSLGASGDLSPLAHLSLPLIGLGEVRAEGKEYPSADILRKFGWQPIHLKAKEGLALLNGTQFMAAFGTWCAIHAQRLLTLANRIGALSLDVFDGRIEPFDADVHSIRPQQGQAKVAQEVRQLLAGSELIARPKKHVQDPYSFRCIPQVHGASLDAIEYCTSVFLAEVNGVTDNPNVFPERDAIISAGNFHGQPLALALDFLCIALAELGSISERRTYQLISGARELPNYLVANPGINSGLMMPQYTAAALVSQNKQLCTPASVDSIVSSNGQEDHVSMGANAALKAHRVVKNVYGILAVELITAAQGLQFRRPLKSAPVLEDLVHTFRSTVPFMETDRLLHDDLVKAEVFCTNLPL
ncbi:MAG: histidine ammonia-lyase [Cyclobacteriaceae bacterium]|nr:histidine ammonia-lyase [Cyclobacteriaceae bacterium]